MMRMFLLGLVLAFSAAGSALAESRNYDQHFFQKFFGDLSEELRSAEREKKVGILLVYEQEDCPFCERFHTTILSQSAVQDFYRQHFLIYRVDIRGDTSVVAFDAQKMTEKAFAVQNRVRATPTSVFYGLDGKELTRFSGVTKDVAEFLLLGRYVKEQAYRNMPFVKFKAAQVSQ